MFQTVCSVPLQQHQVMVVRCILDQRRIFLLSRPLSSYARQAMFMEEPFSSQTVVIANVFCIKYVVMAVAQQAQAIRMTRLHTYM